MKSFLKFFLFLFLLLLAVGLWGWVNRSSLGEQGLEKWIELTQSELFDGPVDVEGLVISPDLHVSIQSIRGVWLTGSGGFPFELNDIRVHEPLTAFLSGRPVQISFMQLRPARSSDPGISGQLILHNNSDETLEIKAEIHKLRLEELGPFSPDVLNKSSGKLTGRFSAKMRKDVIDEIHLTLDSAPPGGHLPAYFFGVLTPYLPPAEQKVLERIKSLQIVDYESSQVAVDLAEKDALKVLLRIRVPAYNLNLNLNITIRVEDNASFFKLAQIMGVVKTGDL